MEIILIVIFFSLLAFIYLTESQRNKNEKDRFREFVMAIKSQNIVEYKEAIPEEGDFPVDEPDELIELDQVEPETLLKAISKE